MKANETVLLPLLEGTKQFFVPLFQRPYSWTKREWEVLWNDLEDLLETAGPQEVPQQNHFFGSIVTMPAESVPEGVTKYLLIDGQQRLTTVYVILCLLRNLAKSHEGTVANQIEECFLVNKYNAGNDHFKLLPTQVDRDAFIRIIGGQEADQDQIGQSYKYFQRKVGSADASRVEAIRKAIVKQLMVVSIVLDKSENPYLIFESLNAKGRPLSQADLIRNYVLMRIHVNDQENIYEQHWKPMQDLLGESLTVFIRHFLMKDGVVVRESDVYFSLKSRADSLTPKQVIDFVETMRRYATYYGALLDPERESNRSLRERLRRLNQLEITTGYPFLLNIYEDYSTRVLTESDFAKILDTLESFIVRRFVCNVPTHGLNKVFPSLYGQAKGLGSVVEGTKKLLATKNCPSDDEFRDRLIAGRLYGPGDRISKTKLILSKLELSFHHREAPNVDDLTIEHVLPQTITDDWKLELGTDWENLHELLRDTLGNLTLSGYNSTLSNESFTDKRRTYAASNVELNAYFAGVAVWNEAAIKQRAEKLADLCIEVWPDLAVRDETVAYGEDMVTNRRPLSVVMFGQEFFVQTWRDVGQKTLEALADIDPEQFETVANAFPRFISKSPDGFRSSRQLSNGYYMDTHINAVMCFRYCQQITELAGLSSEDWSVKLRVDELAEA